MKTLFPRLALLSATVVAACSTGGESANGGSDDDVVVAATADTKQAIGVATWGIRNETGGIVVHGYDADKNAAVVFEYHAAQGAMTTLAVELEVDSHKTKLKVQALNRSTVQVVQNTINGDSAAKKALARMIADLRSQKAELATSSVPALSSTLSTRDLTGGGNTPELTDGKCVALLPSAAANAGETTAACSDPNMSAACQQGTDNAPKEQSDANMCKAPTCTSDVPIAGGGGLATKKEPITGNGTSSVNWHVNGTDLGIPFSLTKDSSGPTGFLFGDTFDAPGVGGPDWRSPVLLRSSGNPGDGIVFEGAGHAGQIIPVAHNGCNGEFTAIPNDGVTLPDGRVIVSFMIVSNWAGLCPEQYPGQWRTKYAGLAVSPAGGGAFTRAGIQFPNNDANSDPYQMQTMALDGDYVYVYSVRAGRQPGPMMLQRVKHAAILERGAYECWGYDGQWGWGKPCSSILGESDFGEPSVRKLSDCTWAMSTLEGGAIVTRTAGAPEGPWSGGHVQVTFDQQPCLYGGFIHPKSTSGDLHLMVSRWGDSPGNCGNSQSYGVDHFVGHL